MDIREEKITGLSFLPESKIFLDIETSGFHPQTSSLFMAGFLISSSAEHLLRQLYVTSPQAAEEKALLQRCFSHFSPFFFEKDSFSEKDPLEASLSSSHRQISAPATSVRPSFLVTFNGKTFDLPFLIARAKINHLSFSFEENLQEDLYQWLRERKKFFSFPSLKLEKIAQQAGFIRKDPLSGKAIAAAASSMAQAEVQEAVLLHNKEDLLSLAYLYRCVQDLRKRLTLVPTSGPLMGMSLELQRAWIEKDFAYGEFSFSPLSAPLSSLPSDQPFANEKIPVVFPEKQRGAFSSSFGDISWTGGRLSLRMNVFSASAGEKHVFLAAFPRPIPDASPYSVKAPLFVFGDGERFYFENILALVKLLLESY